MKTLIKLFCIGALALVVGCSDDLTDTEGNRAPVLEKTLTDISVAVNDSIAITLKHVQAYDSDGDVMQVLIQTGANYTLTGTMVVPDSGFIGDLYVPVKLYDGEAYSAQKLLTVSVVSTVELYPLIDSSWWEYRDSVPANDSIFETRMEAKYLRDTLLNDHTEKIFGLTWSNLDEYNVTYEAITGIEGMILLGGMSPSDTLILPQLLYRYPLLKGDSWGYQNLKYNATDSLFYLDEQATLTCTDTAVYVDVPAGIFECIEMSATYAGSPMVDKFYYSPGVGNVKNVTLVGNRIVWLKELTAYHVEEEK